MPTEYVQIARDIGITGIAILIAASFYFGKILTNVAHEKRIAELKEGHARELAAADLRLTECKTEKLEYKSIVFDLLKTTDRLAAAKGVPRTDAGKEV